MIEYIRLRKFQCHDDLTVELSQTVTVLVGPSDHGKSAVLRALGWVATGETGGSYAKHGEESFVITLGVDGVVVKRRRGKTNAYRLGEEEFYGAKVPDKIRTLLNLQEINFRPQLGSHLWFLDSPSQVAKDLNEIVDLSIIDRVQTDVGKEVRRCQSTVTVSEERLKAVTERGKSLRWVVRANEELKHLELKKVEWQEKQCDLMELAQLRDRLRHIQKVSCRVLPDLAPLLAKREKVAGWYKEWGDLCELRDRLTELREKQCRLRKRLQTTRSELEGMLGKPCPTCGQPLKKFSPSSSPTFI